jgi:hypothetical protein
MDKVFIEFSKLGCFKPEILKQRQKLTERANLTFDLPDGVPQVVALESKSGKKKAYIYMRGTNNVEALNRFMQGLDTHRTAPELTHCLFLNCVTARSQQISIERLEFPLLRTDDAPLKNQVFALQRKVSALLKLEVINECDVIQPIKDDQYLVNFRHPVDSTLGKVLPMKNAPTRQPRTKEARKERDLSVAAPFDYHSPHERRLLKLLLRAHHQEVFVTSRHRSTLIDDEGNLNMDKLVETIHAEKIDKVLHKEKLSVIWNTVVVQAASNKSDVGPILNVTVPLESVRPKEPNHFVKFFDGALNAVVNRQLPEAVKAFSAPTLSAALPCVIVKKSDYAPAKPIVESLPEPEHQPTHESAIPLELAPVGPLEQVSTLHCVWKEKPSCRFFL